MTPLAALLLAAKRTGRGEKGFMRGNGRFAHIRSSSEKRRWRPLQDLLKLLTKKTKMFFVIKDPGQSLKFHFHCQ